MGLGYPQLSAAGLTPLTDALQAQQAVPPVVSLCLASDGGSLSFGVPPVLVDPSSSFAYTPVVQQGYYTVAFQALRVGGSVVAAAPALLPPTAVVDSGTTLLLVPQAGFDALTTHFQRNYCSLPGVCGPQTLFNGYCVRMDDRAVTSFPALTVELDATVTLTIAPRTYLIAEVLDPSLRCLGLGVSPQAVGGSVVLGDVVLEVRRPLSSRFVGRASGVRGVGWGAAVGD